MNRLSTAATVATIAAALVPLAASGPPLTFLDVVPRWASLAIALAGALATFAPAGKTRALPWAGYVLLAVGGILYTGKTSGFAPLAFAALLLLSVELRLAAIEHGPDALRARAYARRAIPRAVLVLVIALAGLALPATLGALREASALELRSTYAAAGVVIVVAIAVGTLHRARAGAHGPRALPQGEPGPLTRHRSEPITPDA